jgi:hypothetical protein
LTVGQYLWKAIIHDDKALRPGFVKIECLSSAGTSGGHLIILITALAPFTGLDYHVKDSHCFFFVFESTSFKWKIAGLDNRVKDSHCFFFVFESTSFTWKIAGLDYRVKDSNCFFFVFESTSFTWKITSSVEGTSSKLQAKPKWELNKAS